ncbi:UDP-N-acetylglucosamine--LPS N-acetylglucosamine transferase, partial [Escherichia coli]|nr:UDP-N-acetylglucosamine--LPS N-acetylglucosamine transferase [Escherichia coli]
KKRILLLSEGFGAGHTQAAYALSSSLRKLSPGVQTKVLELGSFLNPRVAPLIITAYKKTVTKQPKLVGYVYKHQYKKSLNRFTTLALHKLFYTHTHSIVRQLRPNVIVCTHPIPSAVISRLKRLGIMVPLCTVITDYDAHGTWISPEVDLYLVSTEEVRSKLLLRGVSSDRIRVTG